MNLPHNATRIQVSFILALPETSLPPSKNLGMEVHAELLNFIAMNPSFIRISGN
jgi:hypothetical protein